jgi:hypothetical protein
MRSSSCGGKADGPGFYGVPAFIFGSVTASRNIRGESRRMDEQRQNQGEGLRRLAPAR